MWLDFFIALPICIAFLYIPGLLLAHICSSDHITRLALAPVLASLVYTVLGVIYQKLGIFASWISLFLPAVLIAALVLVLLRHFFPQIVLVNTDGKSRLKEDVPLIASYLFVGLVVVLIFFIKPLDGPNSFTWRTDNCVHLNLIARFVETGNWSTLSTCLYADPSRGAISHVGYYPAAWHIIPAMISSILAVPATMSSNVANTVLVGVIIPLIDLFLLCTVLAEKPLAVKLGAIFPLAFGVFPWRIITQDARGPFVFGLIFAIAAIAVFVCFAERALKKQRFAREIALFILCIISTALAHPIAVFTAGVLLVPYCVSVFWRLALLKGDSKQARVKGMVYGVVFLIFVALAWAACLQVPMIHALTTWYRPAYTHRSAAFIRIIFMGFKDVPAQPLLALFVWIGIFYSLYRKRYLWMSVGFASFSFLYLLDATTDKPIKRLLCGFWYMDFNRLAASACIIVVPLAALGLYACVRIIQRLFQSFAAQDKSAQRFAQVSIPVICAVVVATTIFYKNYRLPHENEKTITAFGYVTARTKDYNSWKTNVFDETEEKFILKVKKIVGNDLVMNCPLDGSCFTYATNDLNVYYRRYHNWMYLNDTARYLARHMHELSTDKTVQQMISDLDARYVLLLDVGFDESSTLYWESYTPTGWKGFISIDDKTPGLELVLSEGDMRLYRIVN